MDQHIAFAVRLGADKGSAALETDAEISTALAGPDLAWLHLSADHADTPVWIATHLGYLDPSIRAALTEPETRPRALRIDNGLLVILRGINLTENADPEDMVSLRIYLDPARVVSLSRRRVRSVETIVDRIRAGHGPKRAGSLLADLTEALTDRIERQVADLEDRAERLEAQTIEDPRPVLGAEVADQRLELTELRRFLPPQRDAIREILRAEPDWIDAPDRSKLGEQLDQMTRVVETIEAIREQLTTIRDEIEGARADRLNRNLYVLSMISAVFLPLSFLTGLMGINLAGMPGADWPPAFWFFTAGLGALGGGVLAILKIMRLL